MSDEPAPTPVPVEGLPAEEPAKPEPEKPKAKKKHTPKPVDSDTPPPAPLSTTQTTLGAGAAGVGGGTLIAIIASSLQEGVWKNVLIWAAPTFSIVLSAIWIWVRAYITATFAEREAESSFKAAKKAIDDALANPDLSPEQKGKFHEKRVELDQMIVNKRMSQATAHAKK